MLLEESLDGRHLGALLESAGVKVVGRAGKGLSGLEAGEVRWWAERWRQLLVVGRALLVRCAIGHLLLYLCARGQAGPHQLTQQEDEQTDEQQEGTAKQYHLSPVLLLHLLFHPLLLDHDEIVYDLVAQNLVVHVVGGRGVITG